MDKFLNKNFIKPSHSYNLLFDSDIFKLLMTKNKHSTNNLVTSV